MSRSVVRKIAIYALYIVLAVLLQTSWPAALAIAGVRPDLALILAAVSGLLFGAKEGAIVGLCCGFLLDAQAGRLIGLGMLLLMLAGVVPVLLLRSMPQRPLLLAPAAADLPPDIRRRHSPLCLICRVTPMSSSRSLCRYSSHLSSSTPLWRCHSRC